VKSYKSALVCAMALAGCNRLSPVDRTPTVTGLGGATGGGAGGGIASGAGGSTGAAQGLPCEVQAILVKYCGSCHGAIPQGGAPRSLLTYADLTKPDLTNKSITEAQAALQRIQSQGSPMPPTPNAVPTAAEIATLQGWVDNGYPFGSCASGAGGSAGGGSGGAGQGAGGGQGGSSGSSQGGPGGRQAGGASGGSGQGGASGAGGGTASGLPCNIQTLLVNRCDSCHGSTPSGGAPRSLVTYANLTASDPSSPSMTEAQVALQRMESSTSPMPPSPASTATSSEITALGDWINSGYPSGTCGGGGTGGTAGGGAAGSGSAGAGGATGSGGGGGAGGSSQPASGGSGGRSDAGASGSLPCDVQTLLVNRCDSCHGTTPSGGAPRSLVTYANLTSADPSSSAMTEAQVAVQRMQSTTSPMPPSPASPATSSENWINSGYPSGACGGDAGTTPSDPLNAPPTCTSNTTWTRGTNGSSSMEPGQACISCHAKSGGEAPTFVIAGTLYPTGHEPDNCNGVNGSTSGAKVVVTGNNGSTVTLTPNSAGNFYSSTSLPGPYQAKVVNSAGIERVMSSTASTGDCNSCHTQNGTNGAPGRITLP